jgi:predicted SAM-dependent methyltransferase
MIKINMGCGWRDFGKGWTHIDGGDYDHLNYDSITDLVFKDDSVDLIYASHVIEYFDRWEVGELLTEWKRVLKPGGILRLAVPDFEAMAKLYCEKGYILDMFLGPLYGRMDMDGDTIYHKTVYDYDSLNRILNNLGYSSIHKYDWRQTGHGNFDDHSQAYIPHMEKNTGTLISLNVEACK